MIFGAVRPLGPRERWNRIDHKTNDRPEGLIGRAQYNPDLFTSAAIAQTVQDYDILLEELVASPSVKVG
jgi:hypothetical protein